MRVVLDAQVLQDTGERQRAARLRVGAFATALQRTGRLAAAVLAPERAAPKLEGSFVWDCLPAARKLAIHDDVAFLVPEPFYQVAPGEPAARVVNEHWAALGAPRVVYLWDLEAVVAADRLRLSAAEMERLSARIDWVGSSELILTASEEVTRQAIDLFARKPAGVITVGAGPSEEPSAASEWDAVAERTVAAIDALPVTRRVTQLPKRVAMVGPFPPLGGGIGAYNSAFVAAAPGTTRIDAIAAGWTSWSPPGSGAKVDIESFGPDVRPASYDAVVYTLGNSDGHLASIESALRYPGWVWLHETRLPAVATSALSTFDDEEFWRRFSCLLERAYPGRAPLASAAKAARDHLALARAGVGLVQPLAARSAGMLVNSNAARHSLLLDLVPGGWHPPVHVVPPACPPVRRRDRLPATDVVPLIVALGVVSMSKRPDLLVDAAAGAGCRLAFVGPCPDVLAQLINERAQVRGNADKVEVTGSVNEADWWSWMQRASLAVQLREHSSGELSAALLDALAAGLPVLTNLPAAADYPEGTVRSVDELQPATVAGAIDSLLSAPALLEAHSRAGQDFAASHQMSHLAEMVVSIVTAAHV